MQMQPMAVEDGAAAQRERRRTGGYAPRWVQMQTEVQMHYLTQLSCTAGANAALVCGWWYLPGNKAHRVQMSFHGKR